MLPSTGDTPVHIRSFETRDHAACMVLYREGLLGGKLAENDTGLDMDDIPAAYLTEPGNHFWIAELTEDANGSRGEIVGMIGVQHHEDGVGEIRRLRVSTKHRRRGIGSVLMETALKFCRDKNYLKVTLDSFMEREPAMKLFQKFHFQHSRTREIHGKELMYFYLDIYGRDRRA